MINKRDLILDALEASLTGQKSASCSVSDIAKKAGIAKGGIYYYFNSREEVFDALADLIETGLGTVNWNLAFLIRTDSCFQTDSRF